MIGDKFILTRAEAIARLTKRYEEQAKLFPLLSTRVSLHTYVKRNLRAVRVFGSLGEYAP